MKTVRRYFASQWQKFKRLRDNIGKSYGKEAFPVIKRLNKCNILKEMLAATNLTLGISPKVIVSQVHKDICTNMLTAAAVIVETVKMSSITECLNKSWYTNMMEKHPYKRMM